MANRSVEGLDGSNNGDNSMAQNQQGGGQQDGQGQQGGRGGQQGGSGDRGGGQQQSSSNRGFASMDEDEQREIASKGGSASGGNFANDPQRASEAGRKGGEASRRGNR